MAASGSDIWRELQESEAQLARLRRMQARLEAGSLVGRCGARRHKDGLPCRVKLEPGRKRCRVHGGWSTGPRTPEGKERSRIAAREALERRWARWQVQRALAVSGIRH